MTVWWLLLLIGAAGLLTSTGYLVLVAIAAARFRRERKRAGRNDASFPPVTLLKPVCGMEPGLEEHLTSFFAQQYPSYEIIFGARHLDDPALDVVRRVSARYPSVPIEIVAVGEPWRANAKVCSLVRMYEYASHDYLIISDSDVSVDPNYVAEVVQPLLDPRNGLVTCLYRGRSTGGVWSKLEALGMSVEMTAGAIVANLLEGMKFALGPTMAIRRDALEAIGGFQPLADFCSDDYILGREVASIGLQVVMSHHVIDHVVINREFACSVQHQIRWMKSTRCSRRAGHAGTGLTFAMPFGVMALIAGGVLHHWVLGVGLFAAACLNRWLLSLVAGWGVVRDKQSARLAWLYPLRDLMGFVFWCASYAGRRINWRGEWYRLANCGRMVPEHVAATLERSLVGSQVAAASTAVADRYS